MPLGLFFPERGSNHSAESTIQEDRARRVCSLCPVRRQCLEETITCESPQKTIMRNVAARSTASWAATPETMPTERHLPVGVFGGHTPKERWADGIIHLDDCPRRCKKSCERSRGRPVFHRDGCLGPCHGCRPISERIDLLEEQLSKQTSRFLLKSERMTDHP